MEPTEHFLTERIHKYMSTYFKYLKQFSFIAKISIFHFDTSTIWQNKQNSCWINSIRFFEEKRHVFLPRKNICVTFLTPFLLLHGNFVGMKCSKLSDEISSKVFLVFCVCLLFVDDFFRPLLFYIMS